MKKQQLTIEEIDQILARAVLTQADLDNFNRLHQMPLEHVVNISHLSEADLSVIHHYLPTLYVENRRIKQVMQYKREAKQNICIHDWVNCTFKQESIYVDGSPFSNIDADFVADSQFQSSHLYTDFLHAVSVQCDHIFGFGITTVRNNGAMFYDRSFELGNGYGMVCHGGQVDTVLFSINGTGCSQAAEGWQNRLYQFLLKSVQPSITRLDIAHDDFEGRVFNCQSIVDAYSKGQFTSYRKPPAISYVGDWFSDNDTKGRTVYIGSRGSDKYFRGYEKGKQLDSADRPDWFRSEIEFHSRDTIIDLESLINPHHYFAAAYPIFNDLSTVHHRFETIQHEVKADIDHRTFHAKRQAGAVIKLYQDLGYAESEIIRLLQKDKLPKKFVQKFLENPFPSIHEREALPLMNPTISAQKD